ncbi:MAG: type II toxin-antitoxin system Phd/YefM family antitoxin [Nitrospirae bacterium]|nr:type II toxin-antitoxin system Phd/YefM family antitoxin [Nitrospirota bacterium]MBF0591558.1 type II toxin-antitoxin system Phd/YefM family antitoxin [Nitrospirota bacterium]
MKVYTSTQAKAELDRLLEYISSSRQPVQITGQKGAAILISEDDWQAIQETLYLFSPPILEESIEQ